MRPLPSLFALRAFEAAARLRSFARAAAELHVTPSAVSHQVRTLEAHFGRALFLRLHRQIALTPDGQALSDRLAPAFADIAAACAALDAAPEALALHCAPSFAAEFLSPRLPGFIAREPGIALRLSATAAPIDLLREEEFDAAIVYGAAPARPGLVVEPLGPEQITALVAPHLAAADPAGLVLIRSTLSPVTWEEWFAWNGRVAPPPGPRPSFDRAALAIAAAAQGLGAVLESTRLAARRLAAGELVPLGRYRPIERELHALCCRAAQAGEPKIARFRRWLLAELNPPAPSP